MNRDDIIRMAQEVGFSDGEIDTCQLMFERFATLIASAEREQLTDAAMKAAEKSVDVAIALEREACAKVCSEMYLEGDMDTGIAAQAIQARGEASIRGQA